MMAERNIPQAQLSIKVFLDRQINRQIDIDLTVHAKKLV